MAVTIDEALSFIYSKTKQKKIEILPIELAIGRVLAQDIIATHNLPSYDNSAMDGYAIRFDEAKQELLISSCIYAGDDFNGVLDSGSCFRIMTGARIPQGADAIIPLEDTKIIKDGYICITKEPFKHQHIRRCAEDITSGVLLLKNSTRLSAHQITLLASQGISHVKVYKKPRVAIFASGNELKMHYEKVESHQLYNTNSISFYARSLELGCDVSFIGTAKDTLEDIKEHIHLALDSDFIITSGGASVGDADFTKEAFSSFNYEVFFDKVEIKPGKPTMFGRIADTFILNLPGNPLAAMLNFELFARAIILALSGDKDKYIGYIEAKIADDYIQKSKRTTLLTGNYDGSKFLVHKKVSPGMISPMALANAFMIVDEGCKEIKKDSVIKIIPIGFSFNSENLNDIKNG